MGSTNLFPLFLLFPLINSRNFLIETKEGLLYLAKGTATGNDFDSLPWEAEDTGMIDEAYDEDDYNRGIDIDYGNGKGKKKRRRKVNRKRKVRKKKKKKKRKKKKKKKKKKK